MALQNLLTALRIIQQPLCKNFILTFSWLGQAALSQSQLSRVVTLGSCDRSQAEPGQQAQLYTDWKPGGRVETPRILQDLINK